MSFRQAIVDNAKFWAAPSFYKPTADELVSFFSDANTEQAPTRAEAQASLTELGSGCFVGGRDSKNVKQWCGIFACSIARNAGLNVRWSLLDGKIVGASLIYGNKGVQPGDVAITDLPFHHHFIVINLDSSADAVERGLGQDLITTVDGNTTGQMIRQCAKNISAIDAYYRIE
jgi:hypothetical protein